MSPVKIVEARGRRLCSEHVLKVADFARLEQPSVTALHRFPVVTRVSLRYRASAPLSPSEDGPAKYVLHDFLLDIGQVVVRGPQTGATLMARAQADRIMGSAGSAVRSSSNGLRSLNWIGGVGSVEVIGTQCLSMKKAPGTHGGLYASGARSITHRW